MRFLFTTFPGYGHFHPLVPLAQAAIDGGHEVIVATGVEFGAWVTACGFTIARGGLDVDDLHGKSRAQFPGARSVVHMFSTIAVPPMLEDLLRLADRWRPDLIVHEESEYGAPLAAALLGVPCVTHSWAAPARPMIEQQLFLEMMGPIWRRYGAGVPRLRGEVYLDACPPAFQIDSIAAVEGVRRIRPVPFDGPPMPVPRWLAQLERPAAYVTFGTVGQFSDVAVLQRVLNAAARAVSGVAVTTGPNRADAIAPPSPSVFVQRYVPQSLVLSRVDVVVSHGGAGTTLGALQHGLPHVVIPRGGKSQERNGERVDALGIGLRASEHDLERLEEVVRRVLNEPGFAANARRMRDDLSALPAPATVLEQLAREFR
jgi:UDP:flavonoid glycosyltransferase YjiC (YdhE family)